jgi:L-lysine 2,3-aminomutase
LGQILSALGKIPHVNIIRLGSKMPAFDPWRVLGNREMQAVFREFSTPRKRIYLMAHFDHPRELTSAAIEGIACFVKNGVICCNQCPLIGGVNSDPEVLGELYEKLSFIGCPPYYLFQGRPTVGNEPYAVPIVRGYEIFAQANQRGSGLARRARFCMSHASGKIQILHVDDRYIYLKYHQAKNPEDLGRFIVCHRDDDAYWFDQLSPVEEFGG